MPPHTTLPSKQLDPEPTRIEQAPIYCAVHRFGHLLLWLPPLTILRKPALSQTTSRTTSRPSAYRCLTNFTSQVVSEILDAREARPPASRPHPCILVAEFEASLLLHLPFSGTLASRPRIPACTRHPITQGLSLVTLATLPLSNLTAA